jgi:hypothetical protein
LNLFVAADIFIMSDQSLLARDLLAHEISDEGLPVFLAYLQSTLIFPWDSPLKYIVDPNHIESLLKFVGVDVVLHAYNCTSPLSTTELSGGISATCL